jgi:hypothetical protein
MLQDIKCSGGLGIKQSHRPPTDVQELFVEFDAVTSTLIKGYMVNAVSVDDSKGYIGG